MGRRSRDGNVGREMRREMRRASRATPPAMSQEESDDQLITLICCLIAGLGLLAAALGFLDHQLGWSTLPWFKDLIQGIFDSR